VQIFHRALSARNVEDSVNGCWSRTLRAIESKIPPLATPIAIVESKTSIVEDSQPTAGGCLVENAFLGKWIKRRRFLKLMNKKH